VVDAEAAVGDRQGTITENRAAPVARVDRGVPCEVAVGDRRGTRGNGIVIGIRAGAARAVPAERERRRRRRMLLVSAEEKGRYCSG
jgi:hypothetical protein